jgi:hypothetical protein
VAGLKSVLETFAVFVERRWWVLFWVISRPCAVVLVHGTSRQHLFVEVERHAIAFSFLLHRRGQGNSMGLILDARSSTSFSFSGSVQGCFYQHCLLLGRTSQIPNFLKIPNSSLFLFFFFLFFSTSLTQTQTKIVLYSSSLHDDEKV